MSWFSILCLASTCWMVQSAVLDPALFLSPSPPLFPRNDDVTPEQRWTKTLDTRVEREAELSVLPLEKKPKSKVSSETGEISADRETMAEAETFWPRIRTPADYGIRSLHIPLTFAISGNYGRYGESSNAGLIGSSYGVIGQGVGLYGNSGKSGLAGSSYSYGSGFQGTRLYGSSAGPSWSGWGNGKWGHYGKG